MKYPLIHRSIDRKFLLYACILLLVFTLVPLSLFTTFIFSPSTSIKPTSTQHVWILVPLLWALIALLLLGVGWATVFLLHRASSLLREREKQTKFMVEDVLRHFQFSPSSKCQQQSPPPIHGASTTSATIQQQPPPPVMMGQAGLDTTTNTNHSGEIDDEEHPLRFTFCSEPPPMVWKEQQRAWSGVCMSSCPAAALRARTAHSLMINETEEDDIPQQQQQQNTRHHHVSYHSQSSIPTAASLS